MWPFVFFIPATKANDLWLRRISIPDFIHYIVCPIFILHKKPVFPYLMLSAKQGNYWYHCHKHLWYDAVLDWGLNQGPPALEASTRLSRRQLTAYDFSHYVSALSESPGVPKLKCDDWLGRMAVCLLSTGNPDSFNLPAIKYPIVYIWILLP